jgi:pantoate--beta-alanine ligase
MIIFKHRAELQEYLHTQAISKDSIGFVPTMGALHAGHLSLLKKCRETCKVAVCSIFVNPTQFNNPGDFKKYPKTIEKDILLLEENGCDVLFFPDEKEIYPDKNSEKKHFDLGYLETILEGKFRPGHFQGVCLVVEKLLNIVEPDFLFLGQKDFQQCMVIRRLIELMQKKYPDNNLPDPSRRKRPGNEQQKFKIKFDGKTNSRRTSPGFSFNKK